MPLGPVNDKMVTKNGADAAKGELQLDARDTPPSAKETEYVTVTVNTASEKLLIAEDKIKLALHNFSYASFESIVAPIGLLLSLLLAFSTADFKAALGLSASVWSAAFLIIALASVVWLAVAAIRAYGKKGRKKAEERCLAEIRGSGNSSKIIVQKSG